jgi:hypothetical protein
MTDTPKTPTTQLRAMTAAAMTGLRILHNLGSFCSAMLALKVVAAFLLS